MTIILNNPKYRVHGVVRPAHQKGACRVGTTDAPDWRVARRRRVADDNRRGRPPEWWHGGGDPQDKGRHRDNQWRPVPPTPPKKGCWFVTLAPAAVVVFLLRRTWR